MDKVDSSAAAILKTAVHSGFKPQAKKTNAKEETQTSRKFKFSEILESFVPALGPVRELPPSEEAVTELMDAVHSAGSDLRDRPFPEEILRYKKAVRNFVHYVVENSYEVLREEGVAKMVSVGSERVKKNTVYHQVQIIDKKLDELAAAILAGQTDQLKRLSKMDEITGLLVDLTVSGVIKERDG